MKTTDLVEIDIQLRIGDVYWLYVTRAVSTGWFVRGYVAVGLILLLAVAPERLAFLAILVLPPFVFLPLALCLYLLLVKPYLSARAVVQQTHGQSASIHYSFNERGIEVKTAHSELHYDWVAVTKAKQSAHLFVLHLSKYSAIILPKRCFTTPEQLSVFVGLVSQNVTKKQNIPEGRSRS
jgi:hypothetical protein